MEINKNTLIWILASALVLAVLLVAFFAFKGGLAGNAVSDGKLDTTGWSANEIMNYEMHGTIPARVQGSSGASSSGGMVGGC